MAGIPARLGVYGREIVQGLLLRRDTLPKADIPPGTARRQIEGFAVAIAMALMLKQFTFDTFQVPTESMEPAIIGRGDWGDRLLVDRFAYMGSDPERYDIVVFKYPLSRLVNYVKRAVGLPGETIRIFGGQIYAKKGSEPFRITRKPDAVQESIFRHHPVIPEADEADLTSAKFFRHWEAEGPAPTFAGPEKGVVVSADGGQVRLVRTKHAITDVRRDPRAADAKGKAGGTESVGDVRVAIEVAPEGCDAVILEIHDPVEPGLPIRFECAVEGRGGESRLLRGPEALPVPDLARVRIPQGARTRIELQNADDRVVVRVDGDEVARHEYDVPPIPSGVHGQIAVVKVGVRSGGAAFSRLALARDLHYTLYDHKTAEFTVPADPPSYLMLGDNSPNSLDARGWRRSRIRVRESRDDPGVVLDGDYEAVSDRIENSRRMRNPYPDDDGTPAFIDVHGNEHRLRPGMYDVLDATTSEVRVPEVVDVQDLDPTPYAHYDHYVPRSYIVGRAAIVFFWPPRVLR